MDAMEFFEGVDSFSSLITSLTSFGMFGIFLVTFIVSTFVGLFISLLVWVLEAIPVYSLSKKMGRKYSWVAWIPVFGESFRLWVLSDIAANKPFTVFDGKLTFKNRNNSFWIYIAIKYLGAFVVSTIIAIFSTFIPLIGSLSIVLGFLPTVACAIMEYVYLRDVLDIFKEDKKSNVTVAIIVTALDSIVTFGFARVIYLFAIIKREPLQQDYYASYFDPENSH